MIGKPSCRHKASWFSIAVLAGCLVTMIGCQKAGPLYEIEVRDSHGEGFVEVHEVGMHEEFKVSDTKYSAKIIRFEPDFTIDLDTKEVASRSEELNNPAVLLEIYESGNKVAEQWIFRKEMPHMSREIPMSFALLTVDGVGGGSSSEQADPRLSLPEGHIPIGQDSVVSPGQTDPRLNLPEGHIPIVPDSAAASGSGH